MKKIHYKSDFDFVLNLVGKGVDDNPAPIGFPNCDFTAKLISGGKTFVASKIGDTLTNCFNDNGKIHIVCDNHGLLTGQINVELTLYTPDTTYPDGIRTDVVRQPIDICLTANNNDITDSDIAIESSMVMPMAVVTAYDMAVDAGYDGSKADFYDALAHVVGNSDAAHDAASRAEMAATRADGAAADAIRATDDAIVATDEATASARAAEQATLNANTATANANTATSSANSAAQTANAQASRANLAANGAIEARDAANIAKVNANAATQRATAAAETAETAAATVMPFAKTVTDVEALNALNLPNIVENLQLAVPLVEDLVERADALEQGQTETSADVAALQVESKRLVRDLAQYDEDEPIALTVAENNAAIDQGGNTVTMQGYGVSERVRLKKGYTYLYRPTSALAQGVALCSRSVNEEEEVLIDYTYTYDEQGRVATATADYDPTLVYAFAYDAQGGVTITLGGEVVNTIPRLRTVSRDSLVPMFTSLSDTMPKSGYYAVLCNMDCEAVWCAPCDGESMGEVLVASYGFVRSLVNSKADRVAVENAQAVADRNTERLDEESEERIYERIDNYKMLYDNNPTLAGSANMVAKIKAGMTFNIATAPMSHDAWMLCRCGWNEWEAVEEIAWIKRGTIGVTYIGPYFGSPNLKRVRCLEDYDCTAVPNNRGWFIAGPMPALVDVGDWSHWDVSGWTNFRALIENAPNLPTLGDLSGWDVSNGTRFDGLFQNLASVKSLGDLSGWDVSNAVYLSNMFFGCTELEEIGDISGWNPQNINGISNLFGNCTKLRGTIDLSGWGTENFVQRNAILGAFTGSGFDEVTIHDWDVGSKGTCLSGTFQGMPNLRRLDLSGWDVVGAFIQNGEGVYNPKLEYVDVSGWDTRTLGAIHYGAFAHSNESLRYIKVTHEWFNCKNFQWGVVYAGRQTMGRNEDGTSNGWIEEIAAVAPTIRLKEGYGDVPEDEGGVPLTECENGEWYLNDGISRKIQIHWELASLPTSAEPIAILQAKGYTIQSW